MATRFESTAETMYAASQTLFITSLDNFAAAYHANAWLCVAVCCMVIRDERGVGCNLEMHRNSVSSGCLYLSIPLVREGV